MTTERPHDIVLFGATGFTGRLVADYLAEKSSEARLSWALAGRNTARLTQIRSELSARHPHLADLPILKASADDPASLARMAASARVVLTTVGPYAQHGEPLVEACIREGTDYVDITGEPRFVNALVKRHDARARERGVRIVNCCGFDSIPHDLGTLFTVEKLPAGEPITVEAMVRGSGSFSGGTWNSALQEISSGEMSLKLPAHLREPLPDGRRVGELPRRIRHDAELGGWVCPFPTIDPQIVLRSARMNDRYGPDFRYGHHVILRSGAKLALGALAMGAVVGAARIPGAAGLLGKLKKPGEGPSAEERARGWFQVTFHGKSRHRRVITRVSGGDAGYDETAKMVSEAAMCLAFDRDRLPARAGVLTPAAAMGNVLIERLVRAGIRFELLEG
jgi:short subunit dehydrogenase-like uncharacterized protein